jgi:hypothetical protein
MRAWLKEMREELLLAYPDRFNDSSFCLSFPAQRHTLVSKYRDLVRAAGFPSERLDFVEEPIAAALNYTGEPRAEPSGLGLILDVGAGTTDISIIDILDKTKIYVLDSSSIAIAGNYLTTLMRDFLADSSHRIMFEKLLAENQKDADSAKEQFSTYYSEEGNRAEQFSIALNGMKFKGNFDAFYNSAKKAWKDIDSLIQQRLRENSILDEKIKFVYGVGGGILHAGLWKFVSDRYGPRAIRDTSPRHAVSRGAAWFGTSLKYANEGYSERNKAIEIIYKVGKDVKIVFPEATKQKPVFIFTSETRVVMGQLLSGSIPISLDSKIFFAEGEAVVTVGDQAFPLGEIDIKWSESEEVSNHGGEVKWSFMPDNGDLTISVFLRNTKIADGTFSITDTVTVSVSPSGAYKPTLAGIS